MNIYSGVNRVICEPLFKNENSGKLSALKSSGGRLTKLMVLCESEVDISKESTMELSPGSFIWVLDTGQNATWKRALTAVINDKEMVFISVPASEIVLFSTP